MMVTPTQLLCGVAADLALGDPRWAPHPVVGVGWFATRMETLWRATALPARWAGVGAWFSVVAATAGLVWASIRCLPEPYVQIYWIYSLLAARSLDDHGLAVVRDLQRGDLQGARQKVSMIVGRDTEGLDEAGVTRAVVETVAENLSDGVIAPLFWLGVAGPVGMAIYKAVNTLDSMFGYRNEKYLAFGWCAARMDDLANFVPARLTAGLIWILAAIWPGMDFRESVESTFRDAHRQPSPNSGYPEAAAAGALGVRLGGVNFYRGVRSEKAGLGLEKRPLDWRVYAEMRVLLYGSLFLFSMAILGCALWM